VFSCFPRGIPRREIRWTEELVFSTGASTLPTYAKCAQQTAFFTLSSSFTSVGHKYSQGIFHSGDSIDNKARSQNIRGLFLKVSRVVINCAQHSHVTRTGGSEPNQRVQFPYILSLSFVEACAPTTLFRETHRRGYGLFRLTYDDLPFIETVLRTPLLMMSHNLPLCHDET